jgi:hypothetical protein
MFEAARALIRSADQVCHRLGYTNLANDFSRSAFAAVARLVERAFSCKEIND